MEGGGGLVDLGPAIRGGLAPDDDAVVEPARGEEGPEAGVRPSDAPDGAVVALEGLRERVLVLQDLEHTHGAIRRGRCEEAAVKVELTVVDDILRAGGGRGTGGERGQGEGSGSRRANEPKVFQAG